MSIAVPLLRVLLLLTLVVAPLAHAKKDRDRHIESADSYEEAEQAPPSKGNAERKRGRAAEVNPLPPAQEPYVERVERRDPRQGRQESAPAYQAPDRRRYVEEPPAPRYQERAPGMSLDQAVSQARGQMGGRVLSADSFDEQGHIVHRVKMLTPDGRVRTLYFDEPDGYR